MTIELKRRRFTLTEYHQMAEAGILGEDDRVELIDGEVIEMTPIGRRRAACVDRLNYVLSEMLRGTALVRVQGPVSLGESNEPQPDLALLHWRPDFYATVDPKPDDILLLIEVADSTIDADRRVKIPLYARNDVSEAWLIDLQQQTITVYLDPTPDGYRTVQVVRRGEMLAPRAFPDRSLAVSDILPE